MKKTLLIVLIVLSLFFTSCSQSMRLSSQPSANTLPVSFEYVKSEGNGYFIYSSPEGYFLVSSQRQGSAVGGLFSANVFIDIIYLGKEYHK